MFIVTIMPAGTPANADFTSSRIECQNVGMYNTVLAFQLVAVGILSIDAVVKLQDSVDGINFVDIPTQVAFPTTATLLAGASSVILRVSQLTAPYVQVVYKKGTNSAGTITGTYSIK